MLPRPHTDHYFFWEGVGWREGVRSVSHPLSLSRRRVGRSVSVPLSLSQSMYI